MKKTIKKDAQNIEWYFRDSRMKKWLAQCVVCQRIGYKHDAPEKFFGRKHLVAYFEPLELNENGICKQCQNGLEN